MLPTTNSMAYVAAYTPQSELFFCGVVGLIIRCNFPSFCTRVAKSCNSCRITYGVSGLCGRRLSKYHSSSSTAVTVTQWSSACIIMIVCSRTGKNQLALWLKTVVSAVCPSSLATIELTAAITLSLSHPCNTIRWSLSRRLWHQTGSVADTDLPSLSDTTTGASDFGDGFEADGDVRLSFGVVLRFGDFCDTEGAFDWSGCVDGEFFGDA